MDGLMATEWSAGMRPDWTRDAEGRANSSPEFHAAVEEVARILLDYGGTVLDPGWTRSVAGIIMARLAHVHGFGPVGRLGEIEAGMRDMRKAIRPGSGAVEAVSAVDAILSGLGF